MCGCLAWVCGCLFTPLSNNPKRPVTSEPHSRKLSAQLSGGETTKSIDCVPIYSSVLRRRHSQKDRPTWISQCRERLSSPPVHFPSRLDVTFVRCGSQEMEARVMRQGNSQAMTTQKSCPVYRLDVILLDAAFGCSDKFVLTRGPRFTIVPTSDILKLETVHSETVCRAS